MLPSGPSATLPGSVSPPKLPLLSVKERWVSGEGAMTSDRSALSCCKLRRRASQHAS